MLIAIDVLMINGNELFVKGKRIYAKNIYRHADVVFGKK